MIPDRTTFSGWGRYRPVSANRHVPSVIATLEHDELPANDVIARGLGRSYGDAAHRTNGDVVVTTECDRVEWIDRSAGLIRADAGVSIGQLIDRFTPKGWFVPVTPGTRHVTIGGAIAADIHGKNHHVDGSFGQHVRQLRVRTADDRVHTVSPAVDAELFWATVGGMGLTGIIVDAIVQLSPIATTTVRVETERFADLPALMARMRASDAEHIFSVAWVDLLRHGRSVLTQGSFASHAEQRELRPPDAAGRHRRPGTLHLGLGPIPLPRVAVAPGVRAFNELWWRKAPAERTITGESITAFFHPLDAISDWNRVYGNTGFVQWQCVVDDDATLIDLADRLGSLPSFFTVLKRFGPGNPAPLSFPAAGWTLAVDLPATAKTLAGLPALDQIVADVGGRIYLAKDARLDRSHFESMYPRLHGFQAVRDRVDPGRRFASDLSVRLGL